MTFYTGFALDELDVYLDEGRYRRSGFETTESGFELDDLEIYLDEGRYKRERVVLAYPGVDVQDIDVQIDEGRYRRLAFQLIYPGNHVGTYALPFVPATDDAFLIVFDLLPPPVAQFSGYPISGTAPLTVQFTDESLYNPDAWIWTFGDSEGSTEQNPVHEYTLPGFYTVVEQIYRESLFDSEVKVHYIQVTEPDGGAINISGTLILSGDLVATGNINVLSTGVVIPTASAAESKAFFNCPTSDYKFTNGEGRTINSLYGNITVDGLIDGDGQGYGPNAGPGVNTGNPIPGYGATHAGLGAPPDSTASLPEPVPPYGSYEAPTSLGSGSNTTSGGSAVKLEALNGRITINGTVTMNGEDASATPVSGGASGGSVWMEAWELDGTGTVSSDGGSAYYPSGGGGGGYISLWYHQNNVSSMTMTVDGLTRATDGKTWIQKVEPIFEDRFTGHVLNRKWWDVPQPPVTLDNMVEMDTTSDVYSPTVMSNFSIQGQEITVDLDYVPRYGEPNFYSANFGLYIDEYNWWQVSKRIDQFAGRYMIDGSVIEVASHGHAYGNATLRLHKSDSTFFFQYYDSTSTPQTIFSDIIKPFADRKFKAYMSLEKLAIQDGDIIVEHFVLNDENVANKYVSLAGPPTEPDNVSLSIVRGGYQFYGLDFYTEGNRIRWDSSGLSAFDAPYNFFFIEQFILTPTDIHNRWVILNKPSGLESLSIHGEDITLTVIQGTSQELYTDFYVHLDKVSWAETPLESLLSPGDTIRIMYKLTPWWIPPHERLEALFEPGDHIRIMYSSDATALSVRTDFDNFRVHDGILYDYQAEKPVLYVDSSHGSDFSSGGPLEPLENLFVATDWARNGGIVVLYDSTYNSTWVHGKNLTIRGAEGTKPIVTSLNHLDTTGSGWETSALSFYQSQSVVKNLTLMGAENGIRIESGDNFQVVGNEIYDTSTAVKFINTDPLIMRNEIHGAQIGIDMTKSVDSYVYSNIVYDSSVAVKAGDSSRLTVQSNTIDDCTTGVSIDSSSTGIVASNNLTNLNIGVIISADSTPVSILSNNFFGTTVQVSGTPDASSGNFSLDPLYVDQTGRDYQLQVASSDIGSGLDTYDTYFLDFRGASRADASPSEVGAYEFIDGSHVGDDYYVSSLGNDFFNFGGLNDPFRTLDRAMQVADSTILIEGGHYDNFYLSLKEEKVDLQNLTIWLERQGHAISYVTLTQYNINNGYLPLPGVMLDPDRTDYNIAVNPLDKPVDGTSLTAGPTQEYGTDFVVEYGAIRWAGLGMDGILSTGDILRLIFFGNFVGNPTETVVLHPHFSNLNLGQAVYVSPNGSDSTVLGGDGTNSGGDGSIDRPYRTIDRALQDSTVGDNIVLRAGEYPLFTGKNDRVMVPVVDTTSFVNKYERRYVEDLFPSEDFRNWNHIDYNDLWNFTFSGDSSVQIADGYLSLTYDGSNEVRTDSTFGFTGDFEVTTVLRNAVDPINFSIHSADSTFNFRFNAGDYTSSVHTGGVTNSCWGRIDIDATQMEDFFTEYICLSADDTRNGFMSLSFTAYDCSSSAVNIVGGTSQEYGVDYILQGEKVLWGGLGLDGEVEPGDILRVIYRAKGLSDPLKLRVSLVGDYLLAKAYDFDSWSVVMRRNIISTDNTWEVSFFMDSTGEPHECQVGRGFGSQFLAVADAFHNTAKDKDYLVHTQRRTVALYRGEAT